MSNYGIILAGGTGSRMGDVKLPKQFLEINNTPIIILTIRQLLKSNLFDSICVAIHPDWVKYLGELLVNYSIDKSKVSVIEGGSDRLGSIENSLDFFKSHNASEEDIVVNSEPEFDEIKGLLEDGQMIEAIKVYREITGLGLAEAKDAIDKYIIDKNIKVPTNNQNNKHVTNKNTIPSNETNSQQNTQDTSNSGCLTAAIMIGIFVIFVIVKISSLF